jgi:hypothetical protein
MDARTPHYLRFVRTLALATTLALPACGDADDSTPSDDPADQATTSASSGSGPAATATMPTAAPTGTATMTAAATDIAVEDAGTRSDASPGFSSGPLPPLDMPASMA